MRTQELKNFINEHPALFWYSPGDKGETVSDELLVESVLNYGTMEDVKCLLFLMGKENVAEIFNKVINRSERCKNNYFELTRNYFTLWFNRYVP